MTTTHSVKIYTTTTCSYCKMAKEYFTKNNVAYEEYNVGTDLVRRQEMLDRTHQFGVPVIDIDGKIIIGFDKAKVSEALGLN